MLSIQKLHVSRGNIQIEYNLEAKANIATAIIGASGSGKTTLLHAIAGLIEADSGAIVWHDQQLSDLPATQRPTSLLFQSGNYFEHLSIRNNLKIALDKSTYQQALQAIETLRLNHLIDKMPQLLSGGQRRRIAVIRTILRPEPIILLDEPFSNLDEDTYKGFSTWCKETLQQHNKTTLLVSHQPRDIETFCQHNINLRQCIRIISDHPKQDG